MQIFENIGIILGIIASIISIIFAIKQSKDNTINSVYINPNITNTTNKNTYNYVEYNEHTHRKSLSSTQTLDDSTKILFCIILFIFLLLFFVLFLNYIISALIFICLIALFIIVFYIKRKPYIFNTLSFTTVLIGMILAFIAILMLKYPPLVPNDYEIICQQIISEKISAIIRLAFESIGSITMLATQLIASALICFSMITTCFCLIKKSYISHKFLLFSSIFSILLASGVINALIEMISPS